MNVPHKHIIVKVRQWVKCADDDLHAAQHILTLEDGCPYRLVAYHAQKCAEKYLKAYLVCCGIDFPYTHNIARLLELCSHKGDWVNSLKDAEELTSFAVTTRYTGVDEPVNATEAKRAVEIALQVRITARHALESEGVAL